MVDDEETGGEIGGGAAAAQALTPLDSNLMQLRFRVSGKTSAIALFSTDEAAERFTLSLEGNAQTWADTAKDSGGAALLLVRLFSYNLFIWLDVERGMFLLFDGQDFVSPSHALYSTAGTAIIRIIAISEAQKPQPERASGNSAASDAGGLRG